MSSFFDQSSLCLIPSGYKASKLYSVKPTDGSGDLTFTRASNATRVGPDGLLEKVRTNYLLQSNQFDTTWGLSGTGTVTLGANDPFGGTSAWTFAKTATNTFIYQSTSSFSGTYAFSIYAKAGTVDQLWLNHAQSGTPFSAFFDLTLGTTFSATGCVATISSVGGGWYRCSIAYAVTSPINFRIYPASGGSISGTTGSILIYGAQAETGDIATDYIPTTSSARSTFAGITVDGTSVPNVPRLDYLGSTCPRLLLEPQRTNLVTNTSFTSGWSFLSGGSIAYNTTTSPDGYINAETLVGNSIGANAPYTSVNVTSGLTYTFSVFAKANEQSLFRMRGFSVAAGGNINFDLSNGTISGATTDDDIIRSEIQDYGNGWYRCICVFEADGTGAALFGFDYPFNVTNNLFFVYGPQIEQGPYVTSLISTQNAAVTRVADACSKTGISSLIGSEGSIFVDFDLLQLDGLGGIVDLNTSPSSSATRVLIWENTSNQLQANFGTFGSPISTTATIGRHKAIVTYSASAFKFFVDGVKIGQSTPSTAPSGLSELSFVCSAGGVNFQKKNIHQTLLFTSVLSDADAIALTA